MKTYVRIIALALLALSAFKVRSESAGQFAITSPTFTPGGEMLEGGRFSLRAAVGQHDTGAVRGGRFALDGGFIPGIILEQSPGAPLLKIRLNYQGEAILSWPATAQGWVLEETSTLSYKKWDVLLTAVIDTATEHTVTLPTDGTMKCYRLRKQ